MNITGKKSGFPLIIFFLIANFQCYAENDTIYLEIPYTSDEIIIDGDLNDWNTYSSVIFKDTSSYLHTPVDIPLDSTYAAGIYQVTHFPRSRNTVISFLCWNTDYLYIAFNIKDKQLMAEVDIGNDNPEIYLNDEVEIFIDAMFDSFERMNTNDYQFMVDILNNKTVFRGDRRFMDSVNISVPKDFGQNVLFMTAVSTKGTVNDPDDIDSGFIVELAIPFAAIGITGKHGRKLKLDLCVNDQDFKLDYYEKLEGKIQITWPFNWSGFNDFGYPGSWKAVILTGGPDWFDKVSLKTKKNWFRIFIIAFIITFTILAFLFYKISKLKKIPTQKSIEPVKVLFVKQEHSFDIEEMNPNRKLIQKATDFITDNYNKTINSEKVAGNLGISIRKFQRITKQEINCTPTQFIYIVKLNIAAKYIRNGQMNISEIAYELGFSSPSYFSKLFREHFGVSPNDYKKNADNLVK